MAQSSLSLGRLLTTPHLEQIVPRLQPGILQRVIAHYGLDQCAELVALASPGQIAQLLDADAWRTRADGTRDTFDVDRFGLWIAILMQAGVAVAAEKLAGLDPELVIAGLAGHVRVFDAAAVSAYVNLEGDYVEGRVSRESRTSELGGYVLDACGDSWEVLLALLVHLEEHRPGLFTRLMRGCVRLSDGAREADGFHDLLEDGEQHLFDLASGRAGRRETAGYLSAADARAFLQDARRLRLDAVAPPVNIVAQAYFRTLDRDATTETGEPSVPPSAAGAPAVPHLDEAITGVIELLADAGVLAAEPQRLLGAGAATTPRLAHLQSHLGEHPGAGAELAFLANALLAGAHIQGRPFQPIEASNAAAATCNLGLERWPRHWPDRDLVRAFAIGWHTLHQEVCLHAARELHALLPGLRGHDRLGQLRLAGLRNRLTRAIADGAPWDAREQLDVLLSFDAQTWAGLVILLSECPAINSAVRRTESRHTLSLDAYDFIASGGDLDVVRTFTDGMATALR